MIDMAPPHVELPGKVAHYNNIGDIIKTEQISLTLSHDFMISVIIFFSILKFEFLKEIYKFNKNIIEY